MFVMHCVDELDIVKYQPMFGVIKDVLVLCCAFQFVDSFYSLVKRPNQLKKNYVVNFFLSAFHVFREIPRFAYGFGWWM